MILPKKRDPRFITVRRGGTLQDSDHHLLAVWAADCAQHVLHLFEEIQPHDDRPRRAIELARAWTRGKITMSQSRAAGGHAMAAARELSGAARHAHLLPVRRQSWRMSPPTSSALRLTQSRLCGQPRQRGRASPPVVGNASGSASSCRQRSATLSWMISDCETTSAGRCSTASR